jgi:hypothetical protein
LSLSETISDSLPKLFRLFTKPFMTSFRFLLDLEAADDVDVDSTD